MLDFETNNYNFPVEEQPVYTKDMKLIPDHKCIVRTDTGATLQEPAVDDYVQFRVSFFNSYDGAWPFSQQANGLRLWCLNGCTTADAIAKSRFKHTASVNVEGSASKIIGGAEHFMGRSKEWQSWMQTRLNDDQVEQFFRSTICKVVTKQKQVEKTNEKQLENLISGTLTSSS